MLHYISYPSLGRTIGEVTGAVGVGVRESS